MGFTDRLAHSWQALVGRNEPKPRMPEIQEYGPSSWIRPDRPYFSAASERTLVSSIYTRLGIDVAAINIRHVKVDQNGSFLEGVNSGLNECLNFKANIDQGARMFRQDVAMRMFEHGVVAIVPVETTVDPRITGGYDIKNLRAGEIVQWYPRHVQVRLYNDKTGQKEELILPKEIVAIVENPLYSVMNEPNSTLQRLLRKLNQMDSLDEQVSSGKLDLIIQLPYAVKTDSRKVQAEKRRKDLEVQLKDSTYGVAYADASEKITQLNRPVENNMLKQVEYLTDRLYSELGLSKEVFLGTADEKTMLNYYNRTIEPIMAAISEALAGTFITKTARTQGHSIEFYRDPFKLVPVSELAEIADKFTRNEVFSSNDMRAVIGYAPSSDPRANELRNKNVPQPVDLVPVEKSV